VGGGKGGAQSPAAGSDAEGARTYVYVGTAAGEIVTFSLDQATGRLRRRETTALGRAPSGLATALSGRALVAVTAGGGLVSLLINPKTGALTTVSRASTDGAQPSGVLADGSGKYVAAANQGSGTVAVLPVRPNGALAAASVFAAEAGPRAVAFHPSNEAAYVANFRAETISQYSFNSGTGTLTAKADRPVVMPDHSGPRLVVAHPNGRWLYVVNETSNTIAVQAIEDHVRTLSLLALQIASTLPSGWHGRKNQIAELRISRSGRFIYAINRGHDSLVTFAVDRATGDLTLLGHQPTQGQAPIAMALDPSDTFLFVAHHGSSNLATFRIDETTGVPAPLGTVAVGAAPAAVQVVRPPAD
jgi:6-phosphogluconolactonase